MENKLIWLDLEMTGLEPQSERIIEIFTAITNEDLTEVIEGPNIVISQPTEYLDNMDDWNQDHHSRSGLLDEVKKSEISQEDAELRTLNFIKEHDSNLDKISEIFVNQGPGKISSIRNSIAIAKGIAFAKNIDLYGFLSEQLIDKDVNLLVKNDRTNFTNINLIKPLYSS